MVKLVIFVWGFVWGLLVLICFVLFVFWFGGGFLKVIWIRDVVVGRCFESLVMDFVILGLWLFGEMGLIM